VKVNLGCGQAYMPGWVNVDASPDVRADIYLDAAEFVRQYGDQVEEVYLGHVLEHLLPGDSLTLLNLLHEKLPRGASIAVVTPDMAAIWAAYRAGEISNYELNARFVYSYVQPSHHVWCWDQDSLLELFRAAGFGDAGAFDPLTFEVVHHREGDEARWQVGVRGTAGSGTGARTDGPEVASLTWDEILGEDAARPDGGSDAAADTGGELLLRRIQLLERAVLRDRARLVDAARQLEDMRAAAADAEHAASDDVPADGGSVPGRAMPPQTQAITPPQLPAPQGGKQSMRARVRSQASARLKPGSKGRALAVAGLRSYRDGVELTRSVRRNFRTGAGRTGAGRAAVDYASWFDGQRASARQIDLQRDYAASADWRTSIAIAVTPGAGDLEATLRSVHAQSWPHWSVGLCALEDSARWADERAVAANADTVAEAVNWFVANSDARFVMVLQAGDVLEPDALFSIATSARQAPLAELITWDTDSVRDGVHVDPIFRPSWSPEMLYSSDYVGRAFAVKRSVFAAVGGLHQDAGRHATWDLLLAGDLPSTRVTRIPRVLMSCAAQAPEPDQAAVALVQRHLQRRSVEADAVLQRGMVRLRWRTPDSAPSVTIVIPTRHNRPNMSRCLASLARTDYPAFDVVVVDNGGQSAANEQWYADNSHGLALQVTWWTETPFNYSAVNNAGAALSTSDVLVFLNDDTEVVDVDWLQEMVGWAGQPDVGAVGLQLIDPDEQIQHTGVIVGLGGFADHVFQGMKPGSRTIFGSTDSYRNVMAVTGACLAMTRARFDEVGGFDETFELCGSDVALGLDCVIKGYRNVCSPFTTVRHLESATRGTSVPRWDFFMSYWRYNPWLIGGDPYYSPNLSLYSRTPTLRRADEPAIREGLATTLGRQFSVFRQQNDEDEARMLADMCRALPIDTIANEQLHADNAQPFPVRSINWFLPDIDSPFYGGINTALRMADYLAREHGVTNNFIVWGQPNDFFVRSALAASFPALRDSTIAFYSEASPSELAGLPYADASIATLWVTAYAVSAFRNTRRKFYLIQDFEPMFYPASTLYALTEESYRLGLYGICNTQNLLDIYRDDYAGKGMAFTPAVDRTVFNADKRAYLPPDAPVTVFVYARPGHWRNCWEMASLALEELKRRLGDRVEIVTAGAWAEGAGAAFDIKRLGLLDYRATGQLYQRCDVGLALTVSKHPSYLPLELMASGAPVVAFDNPWGHWILKDGENSLLAKRTVDSLADCLERMCTERGLRDRLAEQALQDIGARHSDWDGAMSGIYQYLCDPERLD